MPLDKADLDMIRDLIADQLEIRGLPVRRKPVSPELSAKRAEAGRKRWQFAQANAQAKKPKKTKAVRAKREQLHEQNDSSVPRQMPSEVVTTGTRCWIEYAAAYKLRYGVAPPRNALSNALLKQVCERIPESDAPNVCAWFVGDDHYAKSGHSLKVLVSDIERVWTAWRTGRKVNGASGERKDFFAITRGIKDELRKQLAEGEARGDDGDGARREVPDSVWPDVFDGKPRH
jgi:hypothetical protein